jgi:hypothetical protein
MIYIPRTIATWETERFIKSALPPAESYTGNAFIVEFKYQQSRTMRSTRSDKVHIATFVKQIYVDRKYLKPMWKWVCQGIAA